MRCFVLATIAVVCLSGLAEAGWNRGWNRKDHDHGHGNGPYDGNQVDPVYQVDPVPVEPATLPVVHKPESKKANYWAAMKEKLADHWENKQANLNKWKNNKMAEWKKWIGKSDKNKWFGSKMKMMKNKGKEFLSEMWGDFWGENGQDIKEAAEEFHDKVQNIKKTALHKATKFFDNILDNVHDTLHEMAPADHKHGYYSSRVNNIFDHISSNTLSKEEMQDDAMDAIVTLAEMAGLLCDGEVPDNKDRIELCKDDSVEDGSSMEDGSGTELDITLPIDDMDVDSDLPTI